MQGKEFLYFFSFLTLAVLLILEIYWKEENSFLKRFLPLAWASVSPEGRWLTASQAVIRTGFPNLFALLFCFLLPLWTTHRFFELWHKRAPESFETCARFQGANKMNRKEFDHTVKHDACWAVLVPFSYLEPHRNEILQMYQHTDHH